MAEPTVGMQPQEDPVLDRNSKYAQFLVDTIGEQQALRRLIQERVTLPQGWRPIYDAKRRLDLQHSAETIAGQQATREHQRQAANLAERQHSLNLLKELRTPRGIERINEALAPRGLRASETPAGEYTVEQPPELAAARMQPLGDTELKTLRDRGEILDAAIRALGLMRGETVAGTKGDPTATGWEGYVPNWFRTLDPTKLLPGVNQGLTTKLMGGQSGVATRAAVANAASILRRILGGQTLPAGEIEYLRPFIPEETMSEEDVRTNLGGIIHGIGTNLERDLEAFKAAERKVPIPLERQMRRYIAHGRQVKSGLPVEGAAEEASKQQRTQQLVDELRRRGMVK